MALVIGISGLAFFGGPLLNFGRGGRPDADPEPTHRRGAEADRPIRSRGRPRRRPRPRRAIRPAVSAAGRRWAPSPGTVAGSARAFRRVLACAAFVAARRARRDHRQRDAAAGFVDFVDPDFDRVADRHDFVRIAAHICWPTG